MESGARPALCRSGISTTRGRWAVSFSGAMRSWHKMCIRDRDRTGRPFVGRAGQLLDDMLAMIDLKREKVFIGNMVKCRPPQNRDPLNIEQEACIGYLRNQVALLKPKIIVCLGRIAAMKLIKEDFKITREHGQWIEKAGVWMMAMYHPSALLRDPRKRPESFEDLKSLQAKIREVCVRTY